MTDDDLDSALARYRVPDASPDLPDRVMLRIAQPRRNHRGALLAGAALAVVAVTAILLVRVPTPAAHGSYASAGRASLSIGSRAVAVAEDGTDVRWSVAGDGAAHVEQRAGNVFYRVEHGAAFSVETPAGTITVTGTCFRIEVRPMPITRNHVTSAALGAVVAATVVVAVYEGGVRVVNARGSVDVAAGERARMESGAAPTREGETVAAKDGIARLGADATRAQLTAQATELEDKLTAAQNTIVTLRKQLDEAHTAENPKLVHPSKDLLLAWAKVCHIHLDSPSVFGANPPLLDKQQIEQWGLAKSEIPTIDKISTELHTRARDEIRELYIAATNNIDGADELLPNAMISEILGKANAADKLRTRTRMSRERAGLQAPPPVADMSPYERLLRLLAQLGNDYEQTIGNAIGAGRAVELRERFNSWPGFQLSEDGCE
jgi:FecR protein